MNYIRVAVCKTTFIGCSLFLSLHSVTVSCYINTSIKRGPMFPSAFAKFSISAVSLHVPVNDRYHRQREGSSSLCWTFCSSQGDAKVSGFNVQTCSTYAWKIMVKQWNLPGESAGMFLFGRICNNKRLTFLAETSNSELTLVQFHPHLSSSHIAMTNMTSVHVHVKWQGPK